MIWACTEQENSLAKPYLFIDHFLYDWFTPVDFRTPTKILPGQISLHIISLAYILYCIILEGLWL